MNRRKTSLDLTNYNDTSLGNVRSNQLLCDNITKLVLYDSEESIVLVLLLIKELKGLDVLEYKGDEVEIIREDLQYKNKSTMLSGLLGVDICQCEKHFIILHQGKDIARLEIDELKNTYNIMSKCAFSWQTLHIHAHVNSNLEGAAILKSLCINPSDLEMYEALTCSISHDK